MLWNRRIQPPYIRRRNLHKFRERPILINPDDAQVLANVRLSQPALMAVPAIHVHFRADEISRHDRAHLVAYALDRAAKFVRFRQRGNARDRKSTRLNSSHSQISYAVFCLKKKKKKTRIISTSHT